MQKTEGAPHGFLLRGCSMHMVLSSLPLLFIFGTHRRQAGGACLLYCKEALGAVLLRRSARVRFCDGLKAWAPCARIPSYPKAAGALPSLFPCPSNAPGPLLSPCASLLQGRKDGRQYRRHPCLSVCVERGRESERERELDHAPLPISEAFIPGATCIFRLHLARAKRGGA